MLPRDILTKRAASPTGMTPLHHHRRQRRHLPSSTSTTFNHHPCRWPQTPTNKTPRGPKRHRRLGPGKFFLFVFCYLQLTIFCLFLDYHPPHEEPEGAVQPTPAPRLRALLAGWIAGARQRARGMTTTSRGDDDDDASPHHRCEQLLAGWITGCKPRGPMTSRTPLAFARGFFLFSSTEWMTMTTTPP